MGYGEGQTDPVQTLPGDAMTTPFDTLIRTGTSRASRGTGDHDLPR
jgi:hypothetical protein